MFLSRWDSYPPARLESMLPDPLEAPSLLLEPTWGTGGSGPWQLALEDLPCLVGSKAILHDVTRQF